MIVFVFLFVSILVVLGLLVALHFASKAEKRSSSARPDEDKTSSTSTYIKRKKDPADPRWN